MGLGFGSLYLGLGNGNRVMELVNLGVCDFGE